MRKRNGLIMSEYMSEKMEYETDGNVYGAVSYKGGDIRRDMGGLIFGLLVIMMMLGLMFSTGCAHCKAGAMRCKGSTVEVCKGDGMWRKVRDCEKYGMHCKAQKVKVEKKGKTEERQIATCRN